MGLFSWLFGKSSRIKAPPPGRYGKARHKPEGKWVQTTMMVRVVGANHRMEAALAFAAAVNEADKSGAIYGVELQPEPANAHDKNAIAVYGVTPKGRWHIGYLDAYTAEEITRDLVTNRIPIAAELYEVWVGNEGAIDFKIIVLAPPGYSTKARLKNSKQTNE